MTSDDLTALIKESQHKDPNKLPTLRGRGLPHIVANWTDKLEFTKSEKGGICVHIVKQLDKDSLQSQEEVATINTSLKKPQKIYQL